MRHASFFVVLTLAAFSLNAQEVTAGIYGTVQDSTSSLIPNAAITLHNVDTGRDYQASSDQSGNFALTLIPIGRYEVFAVASGLKKGTVTGVTLAVNVKWRIDFLLEFGTITESVMVSADLVAVNTANGSTSAVLTNHTIINLPSTARAILPFALLMPGAVSTAPTSPTANYTSVNGVRPTHNAWVLDGGYDIDTGGNWGVLLAPNMEIVEEVRAIRGNYSAEFGTGGGSQFNVITKNGTNQIHGSAYEFLRNSNMNARSYFQPTLPVLKYNDYGFTVGGPIVIPHVYNGRNKTFFFGNLDLTPLRTQTQFLQKLPEAPYRTGDFSALGKTIIDPANANAPFPGNVIPQSRMDANGVLYAKQYPSLNFRDTNGNNWTTVQPQKQLTYQYTARIDHNFNDKHRLTARWTANHNDNNYFVSTESGFDFQHREDIALVNHEVLALTSAQYSPARARHFARELRLDQSEYAVE